MKCLRRNRVRFWFCPFNSKVELLDEDGNRTGEYAVKYGAPVKVYGNVSAAHGEVQEEMFGRDLAYDKVIVLDKPSFPIEEDTVLFVDKRPETESTSVRIDVDGTPTVVSIDRPLFDYIVKRAARTLNTVAYAIERVQVT